MPINPNELRIGNWVDAKRGQVVTIAGYKIVSGISKHFASLERDNSSSYDGESFIYLDPIPLTPELLVACGFRYGKTGKKKDDTFTEFWDIKTPQHKKNFGMWTFTIVRWWHDDKPEELVFSHQQMRCECKYLHQLQNIYFALTGEELTINKTKL